MQITYLSNSGFALEEGGDLLVFDCYNPAKHVLLKPEHVNRMNSVTALISHAHGDHFSPEIYQLANASYVIGFDVPAPAHRENRVTVLRPGECAAVNGLYVKAFGSTDEGVSFYVERGDICIFHAGDLNDWHWRDEGGEEYARQAEDQFLQELARLEQEIQKIDFAFFPVDPRLGSDYYRGAILFAKAIRPRFFIPMHFGVSFSPPHAFVEEIAPFTELLPPPGMGLSLKITV